jgi:hypothetical protein
MTDDEIKAISDRCTRDVMQLLDEVDRLRSGIRQNAATLVRWAVAAGGHTPSAIIAKELRRLVGDEPPRSEVVGVPCNDDGTPIGDP